MPVDNDKLNNEAVYGASKLMQVLRSHVGIGSFIEFLSAATRTIMQTTSVVTGIKADSRSGIGLSLNTAPSMFMSRFIRTDYHTGQIFIPHRHTVPPGMAFLSILATDYACTF